ncbi:MAG: outer membrane lipoprotein-sorting protein [Deltaproteobacteria bacterium]|nr:outer membrane lipoprotein-sorting protein [Deltaproteobacteria bacterium]
MSRVPTALPALLAIVGMLSCAAPARADPAGDKILKATDEAMTRAKDQIFEYEITTQEPGKAKTKLTMRVAIKGKSWRLIDFLAPGDIKGMRYLILSFSQMWVYLPQYQKVRRVASHARSQSFMGTALSQDDASLSTYGEFYSGKLLSETKTHWKVEGTKRPGKDAPYAKVELTIAKDTQQATELLWFNDKGAKLKTETRWDYECQGNICGPKYMKMVDHMRGGMWTEFNRLGWKVNTGIPDSEFTPRALQRAK